MALAVGGIAGIWLAGRRDPRGWLLGLAMQGLWAAYAVATAQPGFLLTAVAYGIVYGRNWWRWRSEARAAAAYREAMAEP